MRWRPVQIKPWMDFSVRPSTCTVIQNFCALHKCFRHHFVLFFSQPYWSGATFALCTVSPSLTWWTGQSNRSLVSYQRMSHGEVLFFLWFTEVCLCKKKNNIMILTSETCFFRTSWCRVCQHGRRFHEACGEHCGSASGCRCQCHRLQWPAGSHRGHNGWGRQPLVNISEWQLLANRI